uniref:Uncharacterized protein n=1 Tax=Rhizophora mucronata TaxID=61149 RepID=A0A2P2N4B0_RHIMU
MHIVFRILQFGMLCYNLTLLLASNILKNANNLKTCINMFYHHDERYEYSNHLLRDNNIAVEDI